MVPSPLKSIPPTIGVEGRRARIREVQSQLESPGQLGHPGQIHDVSEVSWKRATVLKPVIEIESVAIIVSGVARIRIRAEELEAMRETLVGAQQQALVSRAAGGLPHVDRSCRAERLRIVLLGSGALGNHRATDAVEMVQVERPAQVDEMPVSEIGAHHEVPGHLPLHTNVGLLRGGNWRIGGNTVGWRPVW